MIDHEEMLRELISRIAKQQNYQPTAINIKAVSSEGANYSSLLYTVILSSPDKRDLKLFAKVANIAEKTRADVPSFIFETERFVYQDLAEVFRKIEQKCQVPEEHRYVLPKCYGYHPNAYEETIVLEDLAAQGYIVHDRLKSFDWPYASKAVETLARFHALSMAYKEDNPQEYDELLKRLTDQLEPVYKTISDQSKHFVKVAVQATRPENKEKLQSYFNRELLCENIFRKYMPKRQTLIIHGDFRPSNIMHRVHGDGTIDLVLLDYQTIQGGCIFTDLLYFIFGGSDAQFREKYYQRLLDHYYDSLVLALQRLNLDPDKIYSRKEFDHELQEALPFGLVAAMLVLPTVTVEPKDAPDFAQGSFQSLASVNTSSLFPERINGVVDDYVRWGIL